jgi:aminomethyltransferase
MSESLQKTALHEWHSANGGRMVDFAGWSMPVQYSSIIDEHHFCRQSVGLFDVSHMARLQFADCKASLEALEKLTSRRVDSMKPGQIRYSLMTNDQGGVLDDVLVYRLPDANQDCFTMMVVNASNRHKIVEWLRKRLGPAIVFEDRTESTAMIAVQGPKANQIVSNHCEINPDSLKYYWGTTTKVCGCEAIVTRTGYTGEDGCELIVNNEDAAAIWQTLHADAVAAGGGACGLASRDTLRLEAGMPLYGHELSDELNAAQAGLNFAINLKDRIFPGSETIATAKEQNTLPVRIGIQLEDKRAARQDCPILIDGNAVGVITSGTFAPTVQRSISMGLIEPRFSQPGTSVTIDIRGKHHAGSVVELPFYQRET